MVTKVDILKVFISTAPIFVIGLLWINFNKKVFKTVHHLISALFNLSEERRICEDCFDYYSDDESDLKEEEGYLSKTCWACQ